MDISVILSTWNNSKRLAITLDAISECTIPFDLKWELILVNNNCTDNTDEVVDTFKDKLPIVYLREPVQGLSRARNAGLRAACGKLIIFTDDDVKPCHEWIVAYWRGFSEYPTGFFFGGPIESEYEGFKPDDELLSVAPGSVKGWDLGTQSRRLDYEEFFLSANWACPLDILRIAGGFDVQKGLNPSHGKTRAGEETDLMMRLKGMGMSGYYLPEARIIHIVPAAKCTLKHIAARSEAFGAELADDRKKGIECPRIQRIPKWMYKEAFIRWASWIFAKIQGRNGYREYIRWRIIKGLIIGKHEIIKYKSENCRHKQ